MPLRVTRDVELGRVVLRVAGSLRGEAVEALARADRRYRKELALLDLTDLTGADEHGLWLLRLITARGVDLRATPYAAHLLSIRSDREVKSGLGAERS